MYIYIKVFAKQINKIDCKNNEFNGKNHELDQKTL